MASERKTIKLQTLTPVHIGSGEILKENFDYIKDNRFVYILDSKKLFKQLEEKGFSEDKLTNALTQGNIKAIVDKYLSNILVTNYCIRKIQITPNQREKFKDGLREQIYDGLGKPYIPGSSIKGAIRTVLMSYLLLQQKQNGINFKPDSILGDIMRYLQVSDVLFEDGCTDALNMINLNIRTNNSFEDTSKKQLVEAITKDKESSLIIKISDTQKFQVANSIEGLFHLINHHTKRILNNEINFWYDYTAYDNSTIVQDYINACKRINKEINAIATNSCILRLGHANGWKFITGDWAEKKANEIEWSNIVNRSRPNNNRYTKYPFPKSRRINITSNDRNTKINLLGFVKLTIEE